MNIYGHVGGKFIGADIQATYHAPEVSGYIGGQGTGHKIELQRTESVTQGRLGGFDVQVRAGTPYEGHIKGPFTGMALTFQVQGQHIVGRIGGPIWSRELHLIHQDHRVTGRIGDPLDGKDIHIEGKVPLDLLLTLGLGAFYLLWQPDFIWA